MVGRGAVAGRVIPCQALGQDSKAAKAMPGTWGRFFLPIKSRFRLSPQAWPSSSASPDKIPIGRYYYVPVPECGSWDLNTVDMMLCQVWDPGLRKLAACFSSLGTLVLGTQPL